jgi:hypothetical protein
VTGLDPQALADARRMANLAENAASRLIGALNRDDLPKARREIDALAKAVGEVAAALGLPSVPPPPPAPPPAPQPSPAATSALCARRMFLIVPHEVDALDPMPQELRADSDGRVTFRPVDSDKDVSIAVVAGEQIPVCVSHVRVAGTTAVLHGLA